MNQPEAAELVRTVAQLRKDVNAIQMCLGVFGVVVMIVVTVLELAR